MKSVVTQTPMLKWFAFLLHWVDVEGYLTVTYDNYYF